MGMQVFLIWTSQNWFFVVGNFVWNCELEVIDISLYHFFGLIKCFLVAIKYETPEQCMLSVIGVAIAYRLRT